ADKGNYENETVSVTITRSECEHAHTEVRNAKKETCSEAGYTGDTYCTDCGAKTKTGTATPALGHNYTSNVTKEPTTSSEGVMTYTCDRCGHSYTRAIAKLQDTNNNNPGENQPSQPGNTKPGSKPATDTGETTEAPFIRGENGKEGWNVIKDEVDKTKDGDTVTVEMNGTSVVPDDVLDDIKGKDVTIVFDMGGGITWSVNGKSITADRVGDIDFTVKADTNTIPVDIISNVTGERYSKQISLSYDGEFGFTAVLSINMEAENAGLFANLFYYNEKTGEMEFICYDEIAADGTADLTFTHASDYAIVIDTEPMDSVSDGEVLNGETDSDEEISTIENDKKDTQDVTEADSKTWNPWWVIIICIVVIVIGLGAFIVIRKRNQKI
ncbi:MAG: hypothetical protein ACI4E2_03410, partial [Acetatifactor sp.]